MRRSLRTSRMLVGLLGFSLVIGGTVFWIKSRISGAAPNDAAHAPVVLVKQPGTAKPDDSLPVMAAIAPAGNTSAAATGNIQVAIGPVAPLAKPPTTAPSTQPSPAQGFGQPAAAEPNIVATSAADVLRLAKAKLDNAQLIEARKLLNDGLLAGQFSATDATTARQEIAGINEQVVFSTHKFSDDPFETTYIVKSGDRLAKIAARNEVTTELLLRINGMTDARKLRVGYQLKIITGPFSAVVNKSAFTIDLYIGPPGEAGSMFVKEYRVALGKEDSTPPGTWMVKPGGKQKNPKFWGTNGLPPVEAGDPKNPLGAYWIALEGTDGQAVGKSGYGIHGTCEPDSIGKQASLGCIRLLNADVEMVYEMLTEGKSIVLVKP